MKIGSVGPGRTSAGMALARARHASRAISAALG